MLDSPGGSRVANQLGVPDYLRKHTATRRRYEAAKHEAAAAYPENAADYSVAKDEVVTELVEQAKVADDFEQLPNVI